MWLIRPNVILITDLNALYIVKLYLCVILNLFWDMQQKFLTPFNYWNKVLKHDMEQ